MILGFTGTLVSGKGTASKILRDEYGMQILSFSDEVRKFINEDLTNRGPVDREKMQFWGNEVRSQYRIDFWEERLFPQIEKRYSQVVDSFKYTDQIKNFMSKYDPFILIAFDADPELRFKWMRERNRPGDPETWNEFLEADRVDKEGYKEGIGQNTKGCMEIADYKIYNNGSIDDLARKVRELIF